MRETNSDAGRSPMDGVVIRDGTGEQPIEIAALSGSVDMACEGAETLTKYHATEAMEECKSCGSCVRWDLVDHPFWGFKSSCPDHR